MLPDHFSLSSRLTFGGYGHETLHEHSRYLTEEDNSGLTSFSLPTLHDREKDMISKALFITGGNVAKAAGLLDISRQLLVYKMKKHNLNRGNFKK